MDKQHLFSIKLPIFHDFNNLNNGNVSKRLREEYEKKGYELSDDEHISITVIRESKEWELYDEIKEYRHRIKKENGKLNVYINEEKSSKEKQYLVTIKRHIEDITNNLNDGNIPKYLKEGLKKKGYSLSKDEDISMKIFPGGWELYDEIKGHAIEIRKENGKLKVYNIQQEDSSDIVKQKKESGMLEECPNCGVITSKSTKKCLTCGYEFEKAEDSEKRPSQKERKVEKSRKPKEEEKESGEDKQREQESTRKSTSPFEINRIKAIGIGKNILRSLGLFIIPSILIWLGLDILGLGFIILLALPLMMGIIAIIVGVYSGLSSKSKSSGFTSGFVAVFIGSLIVILLIFSAMDASIDQEPEEPIGPEEGEENGGEFFGYLFVMGIIGGISAVFGNSITSNVNIVKNYVCSNCGQEHLDYSKESYLFGIGGFIKDITKNLNDEDTPIWEPLRDKYEREGYPLANDEYISVTVMKNGEIWDLYDEINGYYHQLQKEDGKLKVYNKKQCPNCGAKLSEIEKDTVLEEEELI